MIFEAEITLLAYCDTCKILRPPRSFHCGTCNTCIEIHDHHCPWVGTCVGKRNHRYFAGFLFFTGLHSLHTLLIGIISMAVNGYTLDDSDHKDPHHIQRMIILCYGGMFSLSLLGFFLFQTKLISEDITSNE